MPSLWLDVFNDGRGWCAQWRNLDDPLTPNGGEGVSEVRAFTQSGAERKARRMLRRREEKAKLATWKIKRARETAQRIRIEY